MLTYFSIFTHKSDNGAYADEVGNTGICIGYSHVSSQIGALQLKHSPCPAHGCITSSIICKSKATAIASSFIAGPRPVVYLNIYP